MTLLSDRRSGRTVNLLKKAIEAKANGEEILIVVHNRVMMDYARNALVWLGVPIADLDSYKIVTVENAERRVLGRRLDTAFFDHATYTHNDAWRAWEAIKPRCRKGIVS